MKFYAPFDVVLSVWGKLPKPIFQNLVDFKITGSKFRKYLFGEINIKLNHLGVDTVLDNLCRKKILCQITWGLIKDDIPLALMRAWDDLYLDSSSLIDDNLLISFTEGLKSNKIIESYEIIKD